MSRERPDASEGDLNLSPLRGRYRARFPGDQALDMLSRDEGSFLHQALSTPCIDLLQGASGASLTTAAGRELLDFHGNSVHQLGHGHPTVVAAIKAQLDALPFCPRRYTNAPAIALAEQLGGRWPGPEGKVLLAPGGTEAVGMALKLARAATGRFKTISFWGAFHGASLDAISVGGERIFRQGAGPLLPGAIHVPPPGEAGAGELGTPEYIDYVMEHEGDVGALIAEPLRSTVVRPFPDGYWPAVAEVCRRHGALLIFDEIPTCLGRTGHLFASELAGVAPDMICLGKGLGGGVFPLAALVARADLDLARGGALGHYTHEKSPVGAAAALATLEVIEREGLVRRARDLGAATLARLEALARRHPQVHEARGVGLMLALELTDPAAAERALYAALERGLSFKVSAGTVLTLCPPLNISEPEMDRALEILEQALQVA